MPQDVAAMIETANPTAALVGQGLKVQASKIMAGDGVPNWRKYTVTHGDLATAGTTVNIELFKLPEGAVIHAVRVKHSEAFGGGSLASYVISIGVAGDLAKYISAFDVFQAVAANAFRVAWAPLFDGMALSTMSSLNGAIEACITQANGAIEGLAIGGTYSQAEIVNLRGACETLMDNVRAVANACETLGDDVRSMHAKIQALFNGAGGASAGETSIRIKADCTGGNLSTATTGSLDVDVLWSLAAVSA